MLRPLVHFLLIGAALFAAERVLLGAAPEPPQPIVIDGARVEVLRRAAAARLGRLPTDAETAMLVESEVEDELLHRRARALGVHRNDPVVFNRLVQNMRFAGADPAREPESLFAEALALGMDETDPVVKRRLVQVMRLSIEAGARATEPSEEEIRDYYAANARRFVRPTRVRLTQVFFDREHVERARAVIERLEEEPLEPSEVLEQGDAFLLSSEQALQSERELGASFGEPFAAAVLALPAGRWVGPVESAYGFHLVRVHERLDAEPLPLDAVRAEIRNALLAERATEAVRQVVALLRRDVEVQIAPGA